MNRKNSGIKLKIALAAFTVFTGVLMAVCARKKKADSLCGNDPEQSNPFEGRRVIFTADQSDPENADGVNGHLESVGLSAYQPGFYEKYIKRGLDLFLSFGGLVLLAPLMGGIALAIKLEDAGPVFFTQKRLGQNKRYFKLHKFRSMKRNTPHDVPTHMLCNSDQYITRVGKFLRKHSLDELPQVWDIFIGNMSVVGPRPALWNQDLLTAERDKYGANDVKPGLTGWAQINGRDKLSIEEKARLDGEYCEKIGLKMDIRCFLRSLPAFRGDDSVVEGGTAHVTVQRPVPRSHFYASFCIKMRVLQREMMRKHHFCASRSVVTVNSNNARTYTEGKSADELIGKIGFGQPAEVDPETVKRVLVTGAGSYIGESFGTYAAKNYPALRVDTMDMIDGSWRGKDFSSYDIVYHVAGIAHADVRKVNDAAKENYYAVNTDLAVEVCRKAKAEGVKEFIFMSSMIVYGASAPYGKRKVVDEHTLPAPESFYGDSKLQADMAVRELADERFRVVVLRPPMVYGPGSKGNYPILEKLAGKVPLFPSVDNERSMLYIDNLCEFLCRIMLVKAFKRNALVLMPQNAEWTNTSRMVKKIAEAKDRQLRETGLLAPAVAVGSKVPGRIGALVNKAFGNNCYAHNLSVYPGIDYQITSLEKSIIETEGRTKTDIPKQILVVSQYFYPENFRINDICMEWVKRGHKVTVVTGIPNYPMGKIFEGYGLTKKRHEIWNDIEIYRIPLIPRGSSSVGMMMNYASFMVSGMLAGKLKNIKADYVFSFEVSPMTQVLTGISFAKKLGVPHYLYVQDLWPENVITVTGISNPAVIKPIDKMVDYIYKNTDQIFATSPSFVDAICNRKVPVDRNKVHYWPQYAEEFYYPCEKTSVAEIPADDSFKIAFTGNIGTAQGLQILPKTAVLLRNENVKFVMVGDGRYLEEFNREIDKLDVRDKFIMVPRQPAERVPKLLAVCDAAFLSFQNDKLWTMTIPAKLQSYMACGMPVIAAAQGETRRVIAEADCGVCCAIDDSKELSRKVKEMMHADLEAMGRRSRAYFETHFDKKMLMDQMDEYFRS